MKAKIVTAILLVGSIAPLVFAGTATAWHPVGKITKKVQNITVNGAAMDADTATSAVDVKTGDSLKYIITVRNDGKVDANGMNDMADVVLTDTLPAGVELIDNPSQREIRAELGTIKPKQEVTKEYAVKVTTKENKLVIENKACFTGDSTVKDSPQSGCDVAVIKTNIPQTSSTTTPPPATPVVQAAVTTIPNTGIGNVLVLGLVTTAVGYAGALRLSSKRLSRQ